VTFGDGKEKKNGFTGLSGHKYRKTTEYRRDNGEADRGVEIK